MATVAPEVPDWLSGYYKRGFRLIFYEPQQKGPHGAEAKNWTKRSDTPEDYLNYLLKNKHSPNVGTFLGHEVSKGKFLADVDFDWAEGLQLTRRLLPRTGFGFGRASRNISHAFYLTPEPASSEVYKDIDDKQVFVELRGVTKDGEIGSQTMIPPSIHPSGERVEVRTDDEIGLVPNLKRDVTLYAIACILFKYLGQRGLLHDVRLAVAGFLLQETCTEDEVVRICTAVAECSGNDVSDVIPTVKSTAQRIRSHERVKGRGDLLKALGKEGQQILNRVLHWLGREDFAYDKTGSKILPNHEGNILTALQKMDIALSRNVFVDKFMISWNGRSGELASHILDRLYLDIPKNFHFMPSAEFFQRVITCASYDNPFHPVKSYLEGLKWDGVPRVDEWLIRFGGAADMEYTRAVGSIVLLAAVRRIRQPGCKFDELLVLESEQGMLKSSALKALCPQEEWFSDDLPLDVDAKEIIERTAGKWIIEASELSGMRQSKVESLKSMLARGVDGPVRLAYERMATEKPRQFIIVGTTNSHQYLQDDTGNRRFWPVRVQKFDITGIIQSRDQLWAEAAHREGLGESIRLREELYEAARLQQERRRIEDPWEPILARKFGDPKQKYRIVWDEIYGVLGIPPNQRDTRSNGRLSKVLQGLGFRSMTVVNHESGERERGWGKDPID